MKGAKLLIALVKLNPSSAPWIDSEVISPNRRKERA